MPTQELHEGWFGMVYEIHKFVCLFLTAIAEGGRELQTELDRIREDEDEGG